MNQKLKQIIVSVILIVLLAIHPFIISQTIKLKIIETSDVHGSLFPYDFKDNKEITSSLAQIYTYVKEERAKKDQSVILLDDGDILQGQPVVYYYNFEKTNVPHICAQVMNYMKYDAGTVGNHDIEPGHPVYDKIDKEFNFPWLAANAVNSKTGKPYFENRWQHNKPYTVIKRKGIKIAVLSLITPAIPNWLPEKIWNGIRFDDMIESAKKWVAIIKEKEKPDLLVGLFHSGIEYNYNGQTENTPLLENASKLVAEKVPGFDIVLAGHDHKVWNFDVKNSEGKNVLILDPANAARNAAVATVTLQYDSSSSSWKKEITGEIVASKNYQPDAGYMKKFGHAIEEVKQYVSKPIGVFTRTISTRESLFGDSPFVDLIQKIQLELTHADVSFSEPLSFNAEIKKGTVYVRDMFNLYRFENLLYTMKMSGKEIKDYLEYSFGNWFNQMKNSDDDLLKFKKDSTGNILYSYHQAQLATNYYNFSSAAGINYTVDVSKPAGERVKIKSFSNGKPFDMNKYYSVAMNSYRGNGGGGHLILGAKIPKLEIPKRIITSTQKDLRYYLMKWIEKKKSVTPKSLNNWKIIPSSWWEKGKEKDYKILFGARD
ncbi:MAG TPA: 5'-nucleotidase C-terminal domain-containing protein [Ignavibacteriaceae bacterium]|nr:5'-nucleotidase C-terminal domain-containing protein [Ignavibacteriaceae bacterium]